MGKAAQTCLLVLFFGFLFTFDCHAATYTFQLYSPTSSGDVYPLDPNNLSVTFPSQKGYIYSGAATLRFESADDKWVSLRLANPLMTASPAYTGYKDITLCIVADNQLYEFRPIYTAGGVVWNWNDIYLPMARHANGSINYVIFLRAFVGDQPYDYSLITFTLEFSTFLSTKVYGADGTEQKIQDQIDQNQQFRDEDRQDATTAGSDVTGAATDLNNIKSKWEILWYPIEFSNTVLGAFTGGSSNARYRSYYGNITGYTYDNDTGYLVPVYAPATRSGDYPESPGGTVITFPSYTLPVLNVKLWDSFSYDISTLKTQFPVVFNGIYVVVTVLEVYWFVGFLRDKYEEVFG